VWFPENGEACAESVEPFDLSPKSEVTPTNPEETNNVGQYASRGHFGSETCAKRRLRSSVPEDPIRCIMLAP
jgi:hypothetical protein